jgi:hypothetical protein
MGYAALKRFFDAKKIMPESWVYLKEHGLSAGFLGRAGGVVCPKFFRGEHRNNQGFGQQRKVKMGFHQQISFWFVGRVKTTSPPI